MFRPFRAAVFLFPYPGRCPGLSCLRLSASTSEFGLSGIFGRRMGNGLLPGFPSRFDCPHSFAKVPLLFEDVMKSVEQGNWIGAFQTAKPRID